jgi:hypothetical protein
VQTQPVEGALESAAIKAKGEEEEEEEEDDEEKKE